MYGNGAVIGKENTAVLLKPIRKVQAEGPTAFTVAVAGAASRGSAASPTVTTAPRSTSTATLVFVSVFEFFLQETHDNMTKAQNQWLLFF